MTDHRVLTPEEAAAYLRVNPQTVYRLLRAGRCPGVKVGRQGRIRQADLDAHLCGGDVERTATNVEAAATRRPLAKD